jgi:hypothetical protein
LTSAQPPATTHSDGRGESAPYSVNTNTPKDQDKKQQQSSTDSVQNEEIHYRTNDQHEEKKQHEETFIDDKDPAFLFSIGELTSDHLISSLILETPPKTNTDSEKKETRI